MALIITIIIVMFIVIYSIVFFANFLLTLFSAWSFPFFQFFVSIILAIVGLGDGPKSITDNFVNEIPILLCFLSIFYFLNLFWDMALRQVVGDHAIPWKNPLDKTSSTGTTTIQNILVYYIGTLFIVILSGWFTSLILNLLNTFVLKIIVSSALFLIALVVSYPVCKYQMENRGVIKPPFSEVFVEILINVTAKAAVQLLVSMLILSIIYSILLYASILYIIALPLLIIIVIISAIGIGLGLFNNKEKKKDK